MGFRHLDALRVFGVVARHMSFTGAAGELHLTKGAISYQIKGLEQELGFALFERQHGGISLTSKGQKLWHTSQVTLEQLEHEINRLRLEDNRSITVGMSTYFASRWLSPRLMRFTSRFSSIGLRLQPTTGLNDLTRDAIDIAIRWGKGDWTDLQVEFLLNRPAIPTAGKIIAQQINQRGFEQILGDVTLLHDFEGSKSWEDWHLAAAIPYQAKSDDLVIPDPNVRVQAVIDGQGLALNDQLVEPEISAGQLIQVSTVSLENYGYYLVYPKGSLENPALMAFRNWIISEARAAG